MLPDIKLDGDPGQTWNLYILYINHFVILYYKISLIYLNPNNTIEDGLHDTNKAIIMISLYITRFQIYRCVFPYPSTLF